MMIMTAKMALHVLMIHTNGRSLVVVVRVSMAQKITWDWSIIATTTTIVMAIIHTGSKQNASLPVLTVAVMMNVAVVFAIGSGRNVPAPSAKVLVATALPLATVALAPAMSLNVQMISVIGRVLTVSTTMNAAEASVITIWVYVHPLTAFHRVTVVSRMKTAAKAIATNGMVYVWDAPAQVLTALQMKYAAVALATKKAKNVQAATAVMKVLTATVMMNGAAKDFATPIICVKAESWYKGIMQFGLACGGLDETCFPELIDRM